MDTEFVVSEKLGGKVTCQRRLSIAGSLIFFQEYRKGSGGLNDPVWNVGPGGMSHMVHGVTHGPHINSLRSFDERLQLCTDNDISMTITRPRKISGKPRG
ncbi:hypothetical protein JTE90_017489 [Oedothorax gibbosus]|uniref:Uncharacterized protein n=1 Tax=Oedothorax gibbosus TaxID=931172 RepID=A0AAV6UAR4_9ARAC|nr:hypothetical protein JTE90_017489 [Oedothorax gibbosus]